MQQIAEWLEKLGRAPSTPSALPRIGSIFSALPDLTDADLKDLGVVLGDRRKILRAIARLDATSETRRRNVPRVSTGNRSAVAATTADGQIPRSCPVGT